MAADPVYDCQVRRELEHDLRKAKAAAAGGVRLVQEAHLRIFELEDALAELVRLKDGPRDDAYRAAKDQAWQAARDALGES